MDIGDKFCFCLSELAKRWNCSEDDLLNLATKNKIWLSVNLDGYGRELTEPVSISGWWQLLIPAEIGGFFPGREEAYFTGFRNSEDNTYRIIKTGYDVMNLTCKQRQTAQSRYLSPVDYCLIM